MTESCIKDLTQVQLINFTIELTTNKLASYFKLIISYPLAFSVNFSINSWYKKKYKNTRISVIVQITYTAGFVTEIDKI